MLTINRILTLALALSTCAATQATPAPTEHEREPERPFEAFSGYSVVRESGVNLNGWTGTFILNVNRWFGLAADFDGHYGTRHEGAEIAHVQEHGFTFGPHVAWENHSRFTPFAFALFGGAHEHQRTAGLSESATAFAANFGGGLDLTLNERLSLRLAQIDAAYTRFNGQGATSPRFSAGLVIHFGKAK